MAQTGRGFMWAESKGVHHNCRVAVRWYRKAADQGYAMAQHDLSFFHAHGSAVSLDYV